MGRALRWLSQRLRAHLSPFLFFLVLFNVRSITDLLILGRSEVSPLHELSLVALAFVSARILLMADHLPFMRLFSSKPLVYGTLWKALLYSLAALLYRAARLLIPFAIHRGASLAALRQLGEETNWSRFWGIQFWLGMALLLFVGVRELVGAVGGSRVVTRMFFRQRPA